MDSIMDKKRAMEIIQVHACCTFSRKSNGLCEMCPWNNTNDCENTAINEEIIIKAMKVLGGK